MKQVIDRLTQLTLQLQRNDWRVSLFQLICMKMMSTRLVNHKPVVS